KRIADSRQDQRKLFERKWPVPKCCAVQSAALQLRATSSGSQKGRNQMKVKLISLMSVTLLMTLAVSAQTVTRESPIGKTDVPKPVLKAFKSAYPQASARSYMKVEVNGVPFYRIESLEKDLHRNVTYNPDGSVAKLEERIAANELPAVAQQAIQEKYP